MLRRLADGCRRVIHSPEWRQAFCARHVGAGATSLGIHLVAIASVLWLSVHPALTGGGRGVEAAARMAGRPMAIFGQPAPPAPAQSERPPVKRIIDPKDVGPSEVGIRMKPEAGTLALGDFTFDVARLASRAGELFPFLTRRLSFELAAKPAPRVARSLVNPYSASSVETTGGPLVLSAAEVQRIVDETWARRERWTPFQRIRTLAETYSPDEGQVPALIRAYATQNVLQPYVESKMRDARIWSQLSLAADHGQFIALVDEYAAKHPATKATMELLFLLDMLTEASLDTLLALLDVEPHRELKWTRTTNPEAFKALVALQDYYAMQRTQRGLGSHKALTRHYDRIRIGILTGIVRTSPGGYRVSDARYLLGEIYWRQGRLAEAREMWRGMRVDPRDRYVANATDILASIRESDAQRQEARRLAAESEGERPPARELLPLEPAPINRILTAERDRWLEFSRERLRQFGYRPDSF